VLAHEHADVITLITETHHNGRGDLPYCATKTCRVSEAAEEGVAVQDVEHWIARLRGRREATLTR